MPLRSPTGDHSTLTIQDWPEIDRSLWLAACAPPKGLLDEEGGRRSGLGPCPTRRCRVATLGGWDFCVMRAYLTPTSTRWHGSPWIA